MTEIQKKLFELSDSDYKKFQSSLVPTVNADTIIGVRVPALRKYAKELNKNEAEEKKFLNSLPHKFYEENLLHGFLLEFIKDFQTAAEAVNGFLPYIDNWAVCDTCHPKIFKKHTKEFFPYIKKWIKSPHTYTIRYAVGMLMTFYLEDDFNAEHLQMILKIKSEEYYVNMMRAWYLATALAKQWDATIKIIEEKKLDPWTHNKTIQKSTESFRITDEQKKYLKTLKISAAK